MSDLVGDPEDPFSQNEAHIMTIQTVVIERLACSACIQIKVFIVHLHVAVSKGAYLE